MSPASAARIRYAIRASHPPALESLAHRALHSDSATAVSGMVSEWLCSELPELGWGATTV